MKRIVAWVVFFALMCVFLPASAQDVKNVNQPYPSREYSFSENFIPSKTTPDFKFDDTYLKSLNGVHPRLYVTPDTLEQLREKLISYNSEKWQWFLQRVEKEIADGAPQYYVVSSAEENWMRTPANMLCDISFAYLVTQDEKYVDAAVDFVNTLLSYPAWGRVGSSYENNGLAAAHALRAFALTYDWLHGALPDGVKAQMLSVMKERGAKMHAGGWWTQSYLQNHLWNDRYAAAVTAVSIYDEHPESKAWIQKAVSDYNTVYRYLGPDGGSHEGLQYWNYGMEPYILFKIMAKDIFAIDYSIDEYDKNTWKVPMYALLGVDNLAANINHINYADSARDLDLGGVMSKLEYLASTYSNPNAKWLSNRLYDYLKGNGGSAPAWYYFLYLDDNLAEAKPDNLPTSHLFEDLGMVMAHSDWSGSESVLGFRCGMNCGMESFGLTLGSSGGHVHPDVNAPVLAAYGEYLLRDDGYGTTTRSNHSVLYINGSGQIYKPSAEYLKSSVPHIDKYIDTAEYTYAACDGTDAYGGIDAYKEEFRLDKWIRHFLFLKNKECLIVVDEVKTEVEQELEFRWFTESTNLSKQGETASIAVGKNSILKITTMDTSPDTTFENREVPYGTGARSAVCISKTGSEWTTATAITWSPKDGMPKSVKSQKDGILWTFDLGSAQVLLNTETYDINLTDFGNDLKVKINKKILKSDLPVIKRNSNYYMPFVDLMTALGYKVTYLPATDTVQVLKKHKVYELGLADEIKNGALLNVNGRSYVTPEQLGDIFDIIAYYDISNNMVIVKLSDFDTDATLSGVLVTNGEVIGTVTNENEVTVIVLGDNFEVTPVTNSLTANSDIKRIGYMQYLATVTAEDRKTTKEYSVCLRYPSGLGNVPVKSITSIGNDGNVEKNSLDSVSSSYWAYEQVGAWIIYEFDKDYEINGFETSWNKWNQRATTYEIHTSIDGINWINAGKFVAEAGTEFNREQITPVNCRYVKLVGLGNTKNNWCSLADIGFFQTDTEENNR